MSHEFVCRKGNHFPNSASETLAKAAAGRVMQIPFFVSGAAVGRKISRIFGGQKPIDFAGASWMADATISWRQ